MTEYYKYPKTPHFPWSKSVNDDDKIITTLDYLKGQEVVVTEKLDGENTSMYSDHIHARSLEGAMHESRAWVRQLWGSIKYSIPHGWRVCGENIYAQHSVVYEGLSTYFYGFSVWDDQNVCLSWKDTTDWFELLGITPVPVLYTGIYDEAKIKACWDSSKRYTQEGYVVRVAGSIKYDEFELKMAKFVRKGHVITSGHWMYDKPIKKNGLLKDINHPDLKQV